MLCISQHSAHREQYGVESNQGLLQLQAWVCEWSPEGLYDKNESLIPNTVEILKLVNKK